MTDFIPKCNEQLSWEELTKDLNEVNVPLQYKKVFYHGEKEITLIIDMDPGAALNPGSEFTNYNAPVPIQFTCFRAPVTSNKDFRFVLYEEGVLDKVGKYFGMQDIVLGYPEFDKEFVVKTNDASRVKTIFSDQAVRKIYQTLNSFILQITHENENSESAILELMIDKAITNSAELKSIYSAFTAVLDGLD